MSEVYTYLHTLTDALVSSVLPYAADSVFEPVEFSGLEIIKYYYYLVERFYSGYSWQMVTSYNLTLLSCIMLIFLFMMFWYKVMKQRRSKAVEAKLEDYYLDKFRMILGSAEELDRNQIVDMLERTECQILRNNPYYYSKMLEKVRMEMYEIVYLPNMQMLATVLGVTRLFEQQLLHKKDVFKTLQKMVMLQITVNEGRLASFVNHSNPEIRMMARMNYITCSVNEPYRYLLEDLDEPQSLFRPMLLNYIFGWMMFRERRMPNFLNLSERVKNEESAAYLVREVAYWGTDNEKLDVKKYFLSDRPLVRSAAIQVVATLRDISAEDEMIATYFHQPERIRREILRALTSIMSGKRTEFIKKAYEASSSRETRATALLCLYNYGNEGRRLFEIVRSEADSDTRTLIDQIDSQVLLSQLQGL